MDGKMSLVDSGTTLLPEKFHTVDILGVKIAATNLSLACHTLGYWIKEDKRTYVCIAPVSTVMDCQRNEEYRGIVNNAGMTTPDGMPLVWLGKLKGSRIIERTYGPDLLLAFCKFGLEKGVRHFFYGGSEQTCRSLMVNLQNRFPGVRIVGHYVPPMRAGRQIEQGMVLEQINKAQPDVLWIGLGSPKQDYWMFDHRQKLNVPVMVGVGAAFDFLAGTKPQAPSWMQRSGMEWFFRLCCEPRRLWKRYLIGNTQFIYYLWRDFCTGLFRVRKI